LKKRSLGTFLKSIAQQEQKEDQQDD